MTFPTMRLLNYDTVTDYQSWEPANIKSINMEPTLDDPWAELLVVKLVAAAYSINSNRVLSVSPLAQFEGAEADNLISYLFSGRWDRSAICPGHQRYGQF
jgi:acetoacetate decarboxylase